MSKQNILHATGLHGEAQHNVFNRICEIKWRNFELFKSGIIRIEIFQKIREHIICVYLFNANNFIGNTWELRWRGIFQWKVPSPIQRYEQLVLERKISDEINLKWESLLFPTYQGVGVVRQRVVDIVTDKFHVRFYNLQWNRVLVDK